MLFAITQSLCNQILTEPKYCYLCLMLPKEPVEVSSGADIVFSSNYPISNTDLQLKPAKIPA
jgi:hypothetical protein